MKKWVRALRSGKFRRGRGALKRKAKNNRYYHCCLGVLCEVYKKDTKDEDIETQDPHYDCATFGDEEALLPEKIRKWAGLKTDDFTPYLEADIRPNRVQSLDSLKQLIEDPAT